MPPTTVCCRCLQPPHARQATVAAVTTKCDSAHVAAVTRDYANNVHKIDASPLTPAGNPFHLPDFNLVRGMVRDELCLPAENCFGRRVDPYGQQKGRC